MEILSIGEKIKRARIYKGYTLKSICGEKISISKMSCIENGKIIPEDWVIELVAQKLDIDVDYLNKDVRKQLEENYEQMLDKKITLDDEEAVLYNLECAEEYEYFNIAFGIMKLLFALYLEIKDIKKCQANTARYYNLCVKSKQEKNRLTYYFDIGRYLYLGNEYFQAASYYNNVRKTLIEEASKDYKMLVEATYREAECYLLTKDYKKAYDIASKLEEYVEHLDENEDLGVIYNLLAIISVKVGDGKYKKYETKALELCKNDPVKKAMFLFKYGSSMIGTLLEENAYKYICEAVELYTEKDKTSYVKFAVDVIEVLVNIGKMDDAEELTEKILNYAIDLKNDIYIEKAYYFKAVTASKNTPFEMKEMYMNLSLDILLRKGSKTQIYKRYLDMGNLYSSINNTQEAIKYFSLAINLSKKI